MAFSNKKIVWLGKKSNENLSLCLFLEKCNTLIFWVEQEHSVLTKTVQNIVPDWIFLDINNDLTFKSGTSDFFFEELQNHCSSKVFLVGDYEKIQKTKDVYKYKDFIAYEYDPQMISSILSSANQKEKLSGVFEEDFCGIDINDFLILKFCPFDLFCRISESKTLKVANRFDEINSDLILKLQTKGIQRLFLNKEDYKKYISYSFTAIKDSSLSSKDKVAWLGNNVTNILYEVYNEEINLDIFLAAKQNIETTISLLTENQLIFDLVNIINEYDNDLYKHSMGMSLYSVLIAKKMKLIEPKIVFRLSMAGLFADIGMKELEPSILSKNRILMTHKDLKIFQDHPNLSVNILRTIPGLPGDLLQIVGQHHENIDGSGFPNKTANNQIHPLAKILRVADEFCFLTLKTKNNPNFLSPAKAVLQMKQPLFVRRFDPEALLALEKLIFSDIKEVA